jgi:hypothetical protein
MPAGMSFCPTCGTPAAPTGTPGAGADAGVPPPTFPPPNAGYPAPPGVGPAVDAPVPPPLYGGGTGAPPPSYGAAVPGAWTPGGPPPGQPPPFVPPGQPWPPAPRRKRTSLWAALAAVAVVVAALIGYGIYEVVTPGHPFTSAERSSFLKGCEQGGGNPGFCGCALSYLEKHLSEVQLHDVASNPSKHRGQLKAAATACEGFITGSSGTGNTGNSGSTNTTLANTGTGNTGNSGSTNTTLANTGTGNTGNSGSTNTTLANTGTGNTGNSGSTNTTVGNSG